MNRSRQAIALELAHAFLGGPWRHAGLRARGAQVLGENPAWLRGVVASVLRKFRHHPPVGEPSALAGYLASLPSLHAPQLRDAWLEPTPVSTPRGPWQGAPFPLLQTVGDVVAWLDVPAEQLLFLAEPWRQRASWGSQRAPYRYRWDPKRHGRARLLEVPRPRLRAIQRRILAEILQHLPVHESAHGFVRGRSVKSFAGPHARKPVVLALDLEDFFPSVPRARVFRVFRAVGFPEQVSRLLAGLCTHVPPLEVARGAPGLASPRYEAPHLPQGAPTSPALANLCAFRLDVRVAALARAAGAAYTRYADDLAFSGDAHFGRSARRFTAQVAAIALQEGFALNHRKSRRMRACAQQRLAGVVVNDGPNVSRRELERLEAILFNCVRFGPASQNREGVADWPAHLLGRIGWVSQLRPERAAPLKELFAQIRWT